ncbi:hypothetical protein KSP40_PGU004107 [Platanthera guangdongensis]|uniref:Uncharacterized protein n=1 Tax=Platanthera guangdongensis TaxID=2320717 RepID=A0ABR2MNU8_9ASPA
MCGHASAPIVEIIFLFRRREQHLFLTILSTKGPVASDFVDGVLSTPSPALERFSRSSATSSSSTTLTTTCADFCRSSRLPIPSCFWSRRRPLRCSLMTDSTNFKDLIIVPSCLRFHPPGCTDDWLTTSGAVGRSKGPKPGMLIQYNDALQVDHHNVGASQLCPLLRPSCAEIQNLHGSDMMRPLDLRSTKKTATCGVEARA